MVTFLLSQVEAYELLDKLLYSRSRVAAPKACISPGPPSERERDKRQRDRQASRQGGRHLPFQLVYIIKKQLISHVKIRSYSRQLGLRKLVEYFLGNCQSGCEGCAVRERS